MKGNYEWLEQFYTTNMSRNEYEEMLGYVDQNGRDNADLRNQATQEWLYEFFEKKQVTANNPRQVSQRRGVKTMLKSWGRDAEHVEAKEKQTGLWLFNYTETTDKRTEYSKDDLNKLFSQPSNTKSARDKDEQELAQSLVDRLNKSKDEDRKIINELVKKNTGYSIAQLKKERDLLTDQNKIKREDLLKTIQDYNGRVSEKFSFEDWVESPKHRQEYGRIKRENPNLTELQIQERLIAQFNAEKATYGKKAAIDTQVVDKIGEYAIPEFSRLKRTISSAERKGDQATLSKIQERINVWRLQPKYRNKQDALEDLFNFAKTSEQRISRRETPTLASFSRVIGKDLSPSVVNKELRKFSLGKRETIRRDAEAEVRSYLSPDNEFFQTEVNRKILSRLPGIITVEDKLKQRVEADNEIDFLNRVASTNLSELEARFGAQSLGDKPRDMLIDELALKASPKKATSYILDSQRKIISGFDDEEIKSMALSQGVEIENIDKITRDELKIVKEASKERLKRIKGGLLR